MKVDLGAIIYDDRNKPIQSESDNLTLGEVIGQALLAMDKDVSGDEKYRRYKLWKVVSEGGEVDLTIEDLALIKSRIGATFVTMVVGRAFDLLERA
ncbi:hypothetical protein [Burkholderia phage vB_BpP_HN02]|uniref:Uncharacterized protein n=1 Tax=Burkholderia phage vB_BpP_HN02 TaxID=3116925 RepID=A0AAX4JHS8_9CAUD